MFRRFWCWLMRHEHDLVFIRLLHHEGPPSLVGPMDRWNADIYIAQRIAPTAMFGLRSVASARIMKGDLDG
jgi:hypothetical protein